MTCCSSRARVQLGLHDTGPVTTVSPATGADELGDLLHPMDQQHYVAVRVQHRRVDRAPVPLLPLTGPVHRFDVVTLQGHGVALSCRHHPAQRRSQVPHPARGRVAGPVGKHIEQVPPDQLLAGAPGATHEVLVRVRVDQLRSQQRHHAGQGLEHRLVIDLRSRHLSARLPPPRRAHTIRATGRTDRNPPGVALNESPEQPPFRVSRGIRFVDRPAVDPAATLRLQRTDRPRGSSPRSSATASVASSSRVPSGSRGRPPPWDRAARRDTGAGTLSSRPPPAQGYFSTSFTEVGPNCLALAYSGIVMGLSNRKNDWFVPTVNSMYAPVVASKP